MYETDPHLSRRLADSVAVRAGERAVMAAARRAFKALAGDVRTRLEASSYRPVEWLTWPRFTQAVDDDILPAIGVVYEHAFNDVAALTAAATLDSQANAAEYLRTLRNPLVGAADGVWRQVRATLRTGIQASESVEQMAARVDKVLANEGADNWHNRALTIARTETVAAFNRGRLGAGRALAALVKVPERQVYKRWLSTPDERTRHSHQTADGQTVTLNTKFQVGAGRGLAPGDPALPSSERVNCRCTLLVLMPGDEGNPHPLPVLGASQTASAAAGAQTDEGVPTDGVPLGWRGHTVGKGVDAAEATEPLEQHVAGEGSSGGGAALSIEQGGLLRGESDGDLDGCGGSSAGGAGHSGIVTAKFNPDERRVPKGNGHLSGRWLKSPEGMLKALGDLVPKGAHHDDPDLPTVLRQAAKGHKGDDAARLNKAADDVESWHKVFPSGDAAPDADAEPVDGDVAKGAGKKGPVKPGQMTLADVPENMSFPDHDRTKPGMHALTAQDYVDYFNREGKRIPPQWTKVLIADGAYDPATHQNRQQVAGLDSQGREQPQYADGWTQYKSGVKWERAKRLIDAREELGSLLSRDSTHDPAAGALALQYVMGIRTGSDADRKTVKGHQAIGASTMTAESVTLNDDGSVSFDYIGKSNKRAQLVSSDPLVRKTMEHYLAGKTGKDRLFDTDEGKVRDYFASIQQEAGLGKQFTPKDFRTLHGSTIAKRLVDGQVPPPAKDEADYQRRRKAIAEQVSAFLNNTPTVALESYIMPTVFEGLAPVVVAAGSVRDDASDPMHGDHEESHDDEPTGGGPELPTWDQITETWQGIAKPKVDLKGYGQIDPAETYDDYEDELGIDDPEEFDPDTLEASAMGDETEGWESDLDNGADPVPWHGVLAPEGVLSGDRRKFAAGALRNRDLPLPLMYQDANADGHGGAVRVGNIQGLQRSAEGHIQAWGYMDSSPVAAEATRQLGESMLRGVSVDVDDAAFSFETIDGQPIEGDQELADNEQPVMVVTSGRISGSTLCSIPAFQEAYVGLGLPPAEWGLEGNATLVTMASAPPAAAKVGDRVKFKGGQGEVVSITDGIARIKTDDGETTTQPVASITVIPGVDKTEKKASPVKADATTTEYVKGRMGGKLERYWTKGEGAAKIGWGSPGDFNRCRSELGKYVQKPDELAGLCANLHHKALGVWPGREKASLDVSQGHAITEPTESDALVASAAAPLSVFDQPPLTGPTPLTITDDGRIYGHLATWGTCHIGFKGQCVTPPESAAGYAYFHTGEYVTSDGARVPVGTITLGTGHAETTLKAAAAAAHYDNTGSVAGYVCAGEDQWGIWVAGQAREGVDLVALRAAALSGDWRRQGGSMELIAALAVNVPGFPIPRTRASMRNGQQVALVASGVVTDEEAPTETVDIGSAIKTYLARRDRLGAAHKTLRAARLAAATPKEN